MERLVEQPPDDLVVLAWSFAEEIVEQQHAYAAIGGTFYGAVPIPSIVATQQV